ncbi:T9SS type A sorting domain-containing protein, partial [bacterium]|nr:T9SS type A sorting domain-containing protein [bacterium]
ITATGTSSPIVVTGLTNETAYTFTVTATNSNGIGDGSIASNTVTPSITSSLIDSKSQQISIIPNPVADILNIHFTALKQSEIVKIYSMNGKLLSTKEVSAGSSEVMFNVVNLQNGLYIVKLADAVRKFNKK